MDICRHHRRART